MTKKTTHSIKANSTKVKVESRRDTVAVQGPRRSAAGGESWRISLDGKEKTIVSSAAATATMNKTTSRYEKALRRLAKR